MKQILIIVLIGFNLIEAKLKLVFSDDFNGNSLDENKWKYETGGEPKWGNNELQFYTNNTQNVQVKNGVLTIQARVESMGGRQFTSARINSKEAWAYGTFVIRAKLPKGKNLWPAIWLLPQRKEYGEWPASGEIDIVESRGEKSDILESTIHYGGDYQNVNRMGSSETKFSDLSEDFHNYTFYWDKMIMSWSIDGKEYYRTNINRNFSIGRGRNPYTKDGQPFDKPFYLVLNVAVGGNYFPPILYGNQVTPEEAKHWPKPSMEIDCIEVFHNGISNALSRQPLLNYSYKTQLLIILTLIVIYTFVHV